MGLGFVKDLGGKVVGAVKDGGGKALGAAKEAGGKAVGAAKDAGGEVVEFSREVTEFRARQERNFANGVLEWGKGTVDTVVGIAKDPIGTVKAVDKLASNPVLNPIGGTARAALSGKNPVEAYQQGLGDLKDIGTGVFDGYKEVYQEHGVAGLAGNLAPDIAIGIATGGSGTAVRSGASVTAKSVATAAAKDVAKELVPGPEDVVDQARRQDQNDSSSFIQALIDNFS